MSAVVILGIFQDKFCYSGNRCYLKLNVSDRTSGVAAEGWKEAPDAGKVPRLGQLDRRGNGAGYGEEEKDEE